VPSHDDQLTDHTDGSCNLRGCIFAHDQEHEEARGREGRKADRELSLWLDAASLRVERHGSGSGKSEDREVECPLFVLSG
jgi:hypothetical protein